MHSTALVSRFAGLVLRLTVVFATLMLPGCTDTGKISADHAKEHAKYLLKEANQDVEQVRKGMPLGAKVLAKSGTVGKAGRFQAQVAELVDALP